MEPVIAVFLLSVAVAFLINLGYRFLVNQDDTRAARARIKELNARMKDEQKKGNSAEMKSMFSETMKENSRLMRMNMKPMLLSFAVVMLALPLISNVYNDVLVAPGGSLPINGSAVVTLSSGMLSAAGAECELPCRINISGSRWDVSMSDEKIKFSRIVALLPVSLPIVGDSLGWLGWYFFSFLLLWLLFRRALKIAA